MYSLISQSFFIALGIGTLTMLLIALIVLLSMARLWRIHRAERLESRRQAQRPAALNMFPTLALLARDAKPNRAAIPINLPNAPAAVSHNASRLVEYLKSEITVKPAS